MSTKKPRFRRVAKFLIPLSIVVLSFSSPSLVLAESNDYQEIDDAITKVEGISDSLNGIVGGMLTIMVGAAGGSAVFQLFRRMILSNL